MVKINILSVLNYEMWTTVQKKFNFFDVIGDGFENILEQIANLPAKDSYVPAIIGEKESKLLFWKDLWDDFYFWSFCVARWQDLPQKIKRDDQFPSDIWLSKNEWIAEITHVLYNKKTRILMVEYNHYWPRISTIEKHVNYFIKNGYFGDYDNFIFNVRVDQNILEQLEKFDWIKVFELSVKWVNSDEVWKMDETLKDALTAAKKLWNTEIIQIMLKCWTTWVLSNNSNWSLLDKIKWFLRKKDIWDISNLLEKFRVKWINNDHLEELDLLKHIVKFESKIVKIWSTKKLDSEDMKQKMLEWYNENKKLFN